MRQGFDQRQRSGLTSMATAVMLRHIRIKARASPLGRHERDLPRETLDVSREAASQAEPRDPARTMTIHGRTRGNANFKPGCFPPLHGHP